MVRQFDFKVEHILRIQNILGESPVWSAQEQSLYWVDILKAKIYCWHPENDDLRNWELPFSIGSMGICEDGRLILATGKGFYFFCTLTENLEFIGHPESEILTNRFNDGKVSPEGRFWAGTMDDRVEKEFVASLYCLDVDLSIHKKAQDIKVSNGLAWSPDAKVMYHSCSRSEKIYSHTYNPLTGDIGARELFVDVDSSWGRPDGAAVDIHGNYWSCGASRGRINCFNPNGQLLGFIPTPVMHPTMPCFGGAEMKTLYFTSSRESYTEEMLQSSPLSGDLFKVELDVVGCEVGKFKV